MITLCSPNEALLPTALALGSFDGLHAGHRRVIEKVTQSSAGLPTVVSFWPHPREVLYGEPRLRLDLPSEKTSLLAPIGVKQLVMVPFNLALASLSPEEFVKQMLFNTLKAKHIAVGANFRFGRNREGDASTLKELTNEAGIKLSVISILEDSNGRMSSSRIRNALGEGDLVNAQNLMGRPYRLTGKVVKGRGIGHRIGWPTANLKVDGRKFLPKLGVYAAWVWIPNKQKPFLAVMNLGPQPTIDPNAHSSLEVHLLNETMDLEGLELTVEPVKRIRGQQCFENLEALSKQIGKDAVMAKTILQND